MADDGFDDKTEQPTPKKIGLARQEGRVLRSNEVNAATMIAASMLLLALWAPLFVRRMSGLVWETQGRASDISLTPENVYPLFLGALKFLGGLLLPIVLPLVAVAVAVNVFQVGFVFTLKPLSFKPGVLNPVTGIKRIVSASGLAELVKAFLKLLIIGAVSVWTIRSRFDDLVELAGAATGTFLAEVGHVALLLGLRVALAMAVLAVFDWYFQRWQYLKSLRMTKKEVSDEMKQSEGDPHVKGRIRGLMRQAARQRMLNDAASADVVVTNPVHVAVALRYDPRRKPAPEVVAKGMRLVAERIKAIARENDIPVVENPPLARQLHRLVEVGDVVPSSLYRAVAEVLAFVYRLRGRVAS